MRAHLILDIFACISNIGFNIEEEDDNFFYFFFLNPAVFGDLWLLCCILNSSFRMRQITAQEVLCIATALKAVLNSAF